MIRIFISYSSQDSKFADRLARDLDKIGVNVFYAKWNIRVGDSIVEKINNALSSYDNLLVILSSSSINSTWVKRELNSSLMRQLNEQKIRIFPILLENCDIPPLLGDIKYANFTNEYHVGFRELISALEVDISLKPYLEIVEQSCPDINTHEKQRELTIALKSVNPIPFFRNEILFVINAHKCISQQDLLTRYNTKKSIFTELQSESIFIELQHLKNDDLIEEKEVDGINYFKITNLGGLICRCLSYGFNEGLLSPTCLH